MHRFASHQERHDREDHGAGKPAKHTYFPRPETEARVTGSRSREIVGHCCYQKCNHMRAHVPAVGQQRHRTRHQPNGDLDNHHRGRNTDHDAGAPFRVRKIRNEIVCLPETGMISSMH